MAILYPWKQNLSASQMIRLGITGGIGSGKSTICRIFQLFGVPVYYADARAKWLIENDESLVKDIVKLLGKEAYQNGIYNSSYVGTKVFKNRKLLDELNSLVHPVVRQDWKHWSESLQKKGERIVLKEAAIMYAAKEDPSLDKVIYVFAPESVRMQRVLSRDPFRNTKSIGNIIAKQRSESSYRDIADFVLENNDDSLVIPQVKQIMKELQTNV